MSVPSRRLLLLLPLLLPALLAPSPAWAAAREQVGDPPEPPAATAASSEDLAPRHPEFLEIAAPLLSERERQVFLGLKQEYQRDELHEALEPVAGAAAAFGYGVQVPAAVVTGRKTPAGSLPRDALTLPAATHALAGGTLYMRVLFLYKPPGRKRLRSARTRCKPAFSACPADLRAWEPF